ncbi:MAG: MBL fold metallo-hydrolase [Verrucomicrobiales bacterium]|nr:MBL fold metallo-hydrolase [Verrucomicrobiales bacterium]
MLRFAVLGSGSSGNSAVVCHGATRVLIDAGLSARQLEQRLLALGIEPDSIQAVVLTHEHGDHVGGLDVFCRKRPLPVYGTRDTCTVVGEGLKSRVHWQKFEAGQAFTVGPLAFDSFSVPHDAVDPVGFVVSDPSSGNRVGILSDVGQVTTLIRDRLKAIDTLFVEANYDETLLQNDTKRPWATKQRISSRHGHLSNDQAAELIVSVATERLHRVVLGHLSRDCNTPEVAIRAIHGQLVKAGFADVHVECACPKHPLPLREAARHAPPPGASPRLSEADGDATPADASDDASPRDEKAEARPPRRSLRSASPQPSESFPGWQQGEWAF